MDRRFRVRWIFDALGILVAYGLIRDVFYFGTPTDILIDAIIMCVYFSLGFALEFFVRRARILVFVVIILTALVLVPGVALGLLFDIKTGLWSTLGLALMVYLFMGVRRLSAEIRFARNS